jgi:hypothetical protein
LIPFRRTARKFFGATNSRIDDAGKAAIRDYGPAGLTYNGRALDQLT